jgi:hypothetical protein
MSALGSAGASKRDIFYELNVLLGSPNRVITAGLGLLLIIFGVTVLAWQFLTGWLIVSAAPVVALVCGLIAFHLALNASIDL